MPDATPSTYVYPETERVVHGPGAVSTLAAECDRLSAKRALLLTTRSLHGTPTQDSVLQALGDRVALVLPDASQHVPLPTMTAVIDRCAQLQPDLIVSLGGGSVIDSGKALAAALANHCSDGEELYRHRIVFTPPEQIEQDPFTAEPIPHVAIPTTLSAAEYDGIFGMTKEGTKDLYADPRLAPRVVVLDPAVTLATPARLWASSGIRALDHAIEIYLSRQPSPITDATCLHAVRLLRSELKRSVEDPADLQSRLRCQHASWLSMFGVENVTLGLCHGIGHQIGARCNVPHGITSCVMLPTVLEAMVEISPGRMADLALAIGVDGVGRSQRELAAALPGAVRQFIADLSLPTRLSEVGVTEADFPQIAHDSVHDFVVATAPLSVDEKAVIELLSAAG